MWHTFIPVLSIIILVTRVRLRLRGDRLRLSAFLLKTQLFQDELRRDAVFKQLLLASFRVQTDRWRSRSVKKIARFVVVVVVPW